MPKRGTETGGEGLELTSIQWLLDHHATKEGERQQMVDDLGISLGCRLMDLGCGPGLWTPLFAKKLSEHGKIHGVDFDENLIDFAKQHNNHLIEAGIADFSVADFNSLPFADDSFDLVFAGNCTMYVADFARFFTELKRVTTNGGRIAEKSFEGSCLIYYPIEPGLTARVLAGVAASQCEDVGQDHFDNYCGSSSIDRFRAANLQSIHAKTYAIQKTAPLSLSAKRYLTSNALWHGQVCAEFVSPRDLELWHSHFDPNSDHYILDRPEFYFCMLEVLTIGTVVK